MKVTVYFGNVRVIVPCGKGDILVRDLMDLSITRYKKATGKSQSSVVTIHNLKSSRDDGILYPDDKLSDVADDREQIIAVFEEGYSPLPPYSCGDVTSTSSVYTGSPDLFSVEVGSHGSNTETEDNPPLGVMPLQVRRGSEPALNNLFPESSSTDPSKRWSTAVVINTTDASQEQNCVHENGLEDRVSPVESLDINGDSKLSSLTTFSRGSGRLSILGNSAETYRWVEAADRQLMKDFNENFHLKCTSLDAGSDTSSLSDEREKTIILKNESGPLGIHVVPDYDSKGRDTGLVIQGIEAGGRIDRDGRFHVGDRITEINGKSLQNVSFQTAQEIFKSALKSSQIRLELVRGQGHLQSKTAAVPKKPPPPVYPKPSTGETTKKPDEEGAALVEGEERAGGVSTKVATVTPTKKVPASAMRRLASANTRRIGKMLTIELTKGSSGLGFSITTRDNPAGGNSPIYIKNVLPKGAAIEDGRLQPGDRLLEVNGTPMTGKSQTEAVSILRNIPLGKSVQLVVSRQEVEETEAAETENEVVTNKIEDETGIFPWKYREILTFQIPLTDSHSAGLGVSVKGKSTTTANGSVDLGIFIKSVIPGGAASKDGRLQTNDQLVNINGISLLGMSNSNAMETLRNAMTQTDGPIRNAIILTIARRINVPNENGSDGINPPAKLETTSGVKSSGNISDDSLERNSLKQNGLPILTQLTDLDDIQKNTPGLPGCNPVIERLTGLSSSEKSTGDIYGYSRHGTNGTDDKKLLYSGPISSSQGETVLIEGEYDPGMKKNSIDSQQMNGSVTENLNVVPAESQLSLDESNPGFARDGFGRQSMSEKRHAQLDARNTGTYQRNKKAREERQQQSFESEEAMEDDKRTSPVAGVISAPSRNEVVGPSLGLRKSSSLESLQTMLQELNKDDEALKRALQSGSSRSARGRGCNESFRAAVDRSYDAPATAVTMETLDEESESGSHILTRSVEDPFHDDLLSMYCRNSKSSKKKSLLKGLGSVFKFGKNRKQSQDLKGKDDDSAQDSDFSQPHSSTSQKEQDKLSDSSREGGRRQLPQIPREHSPLSSVDSVPNRQERMQSLREQYQRMHQRRQGQYPLEQKEEYYENELKEKEGNYAMPFEVIHGRSQSLDIHKETPHGSSKVHPIGDPNRYSHYMNYKEIQQHINQRSHHGPPVKNPPKPDPKPLPSVLPDIPPPGTFFDHTGHHLMKKHTVSQSSDVSSNSLPRGTHTTEHGLGHSQGKPYFVHEAHDHGNYGRMNVHHFYPNNKLYSHIVPGSKV
ncbi:unnamed protein product [Larinioides sclopetarius]|uniref:PDZ domain-containing protein n=1 Tax=Larinioides sclopetarius TaxID=280406 RepID=A0AAV1ZYM8_9ARAC